MRDQRDSTVEHIEMVSTASADQVRKQLSSEESSTTAKRDFDAVEKEKNEEGGEPSNKK